MKIRWRAFATALLLLGAAGTARAQGVDLMRATCSDYAAMNESDRQQLALWLAGYFAGGAQRPLLDVEKVAAAPAELAALCAKTPALPLIGSETRAVFLPQPAP